MLEAGAAIQSVLSAFGLSASAGLNAYIPLLVIGVGARLRPDMIRLSEPFDLLTTWWALALITTLLVIEVFADKVPLIDHINDLVGLFVRPVAGAILFAASTGTVAFLDPRLALVLGFFVAGATHGVKATTRPVVTASTQGVGNPVVSTVEDIAAFLTSVVAIMAPILLAVAMLGFAVLFVVWMARRPRAAAPAPLASDGGDR